MTAEGAYHHLSLLKRFWIFQKERFPLVLNLVAIAVFNFSAITYSRVFRNAEGFIAWKDYAVGIASTYTLFFLVRVLDEFKDAQHDLQHRAYLPIPRGVISLKELGWIAGVWTTLQVAALLMVQPTMFYYYFVVLAYLFLMRYEFFLSAWLKKNPMINNLAHMLVIPLLDIYASGLDWKIAGVQPHLGLLFFFGLSYFNGFVYEFGRKLRTPEAEESGVLSYTKLFGPRGGPIGWLLILTTTYVICWFAADFAGLHVAAKYSLTLFYLLCQVPAWQFIFHPTTSLSKKIEVASGVWGLTMYLTLGLTPYLIN